jgi:protein-tyrosine phosphatase
MDSYRKAPADVGLPDGASEDERVRWIELDGAVNVRDLGGLDTDDGRTTHAGRLLRGDNLQGLSPADVKLLVDDIGVTTVVDLRAPAEVESEGPGPLTQVGSVRHAHHSVLPEAGSATDVAADALANLRRDDALSRYPDDVRCGYYLGYLEDRPDQVAGALRSIAAAPGAALVNCAAGKDRTGVVVALALTAVGVKREAVVADYAASGERIVAVLDRLRSSRTYAADINSRPNPAADDTPRPETMAAFLDQLNVRYGGAAGWLADHGFGPDDVAALRAKLLGPA